MKLNILNNIDYESLSSKIFRANNKTILSRQWCYVLSSFMVVYVILQTLIGINGKLSSQDRICNYEYTPKLWVQKINIFTVFCFVGTAAHIVIRMVFDKKNVSPESFSCNILLIAKVSD